MKKYISLVVGFLAVANLTYGFFTNQTEAAIFGIEMNIWTYRAIWAFFALFSFYDFYKKSKPENN